PMIIIFFTSGAFELGDIVGMIVLSGITVNNAIYITESKKQNYSFKLREKIKSILVTSLTTVAGAVPLYLLSADSFSKSLSFFMIWGIISSVIIVLSSPQSLPLTPEHPAPRNAGSCAEG
ncbi:MAG: efflux RND transporter permease subunit, partial [Treponema sp.]|nr:efflux RND transporter permease subunit [Treponema sp.]